MSDTPVKALLCDLDGTLLDVDMEEFMKPYFAALVPYVSPYLPGVEVVKALMASTQAMMASHPTLTNEEAFWSDFTARVHVAREAIEPVFVRFYKEVFPSLGRYTRQVPEARVLVQAAMAHGLDVVVATNPIFPAIAIETRLGWAGLAGLPFRHVTTMENSHYTKPSRAYFEEILAVIGRRPEECLMVGNDPQMDLPEVDLGLRTFLVSAVPDGAAVDFHGTLRDLAAMLPRLAAGNGNPW